MTPSGRLIGLFLVAAVGALAIFAGATSLRVAFSAEETAQSQPYCIQIADEASNYRPARSWLDLSALTMWAKRDGPLYMQHHAVLVVGEADNLGLYHWSYRSRAFEARVLNGQIEARGPAVTCLPERNFASKRLVLFPEPTDSNYVRYSAHDIYRIPSVWQAMWSGGMSPSLRLVTAAPDFQPLTQRWSDFARGERDSNWIVVEWNPEWVLNLMRATPSGNVVEQSTEFGLAKTKTVTHGGDGKQYVGYGYVVHADDSPSNNGINTTVIGCGTPTEAFPKSCQHRFINKGRHFYFRHQPKDVADWRAMQGRILALMESFEVHDSAFGGRPQSR